MWGAVGSGPGVLGPTKLYPGVTFVPERGKAFGSRISYDQERYGDGWFRKSHVPRQRGMLLLLRANSQRHCRPSMRDPSDPDLPPDRPCARDSDSDSRFDSSVGAEYGTVDSGTNILLGAYAHLPLLPCFFFSSFQLPPTSSPQLHCLPPSFLLSPASPYFLSFSPCPPGPSSPPLIDTPTISS